jgi:hydroxymethylpyrimidine/phosphomethylpyrimidine kinase
MIARALTIAGSDSGGGAGIQADLKTFQALGVWGMTAITAVTVQNTIWVSGAVAVSPRIVADQIAAVAGDIGVDAAKTGMLGDAAIVGAVARAVRDAEIDQLVVDPVLVSKHGDPLLSPEGFDALVAELFPLALLVTPNTIEAERLAGGTVTNRAEQVEAARAIQAMGPRAVLVKGGHLEGEATDILCYGGQVVEIRARRIDAVNTHGTGCVLSAAIVAVLAKGKPLEPAVRQAKDFVTGAIEHGLALGKGIGPIDPSWRFLRK